jgi:hypothetical protein
MHQQTKPALCVVIDRASDGVAKQLYLVEIHTQAVVLRVPVEEAPELKQRIRRRLDARNKRT